MSDLVLVVGTGRSGTSLLSGILGQVGFHIPQPEVQADETNPKGFGEPKWVVDLHSRLLRERRVGNTDARPDAFESTYGAAADPAAVEQLRSWLGDQLAHGDVVVKDPRTGWFLPLWLACSQPRFVTMLRHPAEIVASGRRSYGTKLTAATRTCAWLNMMLETEHATRGARRALVRYEDLLADWAGELRRAGEQLELPRLQQVSAERHPGADAFVDPSLHRERVRWEGLDVPERVRELAEHVWALFDGGGSEGDFDRARERYRALYAEAEAIAQSSVLAARRRKPKPQPEPSRLRRMLGR